jgi:hypothetical protein
MTEQGYIIQTTDTIGGEKHRERKHRVTSRETAAAPALALEIILRCLEIFCLPNEVCRFTQGDSYFRRLEFRYRKSAFVRDIAELRDNIPISTRAREKALIAHDRGLKPPSNTGSIRQNNAESIPLSMTIANDKSSIGFSRTPNKKHQSQNERSGIIV